jgi:hypothetical protein
MKNKTLMFVVLALLLSGVSAEKSIMEAAEKISNPHILTGNVPGSRGIDGIDLNPQIGRHNSYAWAGELFRQTDGDYIWVATNRDLAGHTANRLGLDFNNVIIPPDSEAGQLMNIVPPVNPDGAARIYRLRASDPNALWELVYADARVSGFRRMIVFNDELFVIAGLTNILVSDYSYILRFPNDFTPGSEKKPDIVLWEDLANNMLMVDTHLTGSAFEQFRAAEVHDGRLYVGTFNSRIYATDGTGLRDLTPRSGCNMEGWEPVLNLQDYGVGMPAVWELLSFNGYLYIFSVTFRGFRIDRISTEQGTYTLEHIVGDPPARFPHGFGNGGNMAASGFVSTAFGEEYMYVTTFADAPRMLTNFANGESDTVFTHNFNPASIFRVCTQDNWEIIAGETEGRLAPRDWSGNILPHISSHRAGFSLLPEDKINTSLNQYVWWMGEHDGKLYASTLNLGTIWEYGLWMMLEIHSLVPGSGVMLVNSENLDLDSYLDFYVGLHRLIAHYSHRIDFPALITAADAYMDSVANVPRDDRRPIVQGLFQVISAHMPTDSLKRGVLGLVDVFTQIANTLTPASDNSHTPPRDVSWHEIVVRVLTTYGVSASFFADDLSPVGFHMYVSCDGINFNPVTVNGLGDQFNYGGRLYIPSDHGMFFLTANPFFGGQVWRVDPMQLGIYPNGPQVLTVRNAVQVMTVLVRNSGATEGILQVAYDSDLVRVVLTRHQSREISNFTWDNQVAFEADRNLWYYDVSETETKHEQVLYNIMLIPLKAGQENLTLNFELDSIIVQRSIDINVAF